MADLFDTLAGQRIARLLTSEEYLWILENTRDIEMIIGLVGATIDIWSEMHDTSPDLVYRYLAEARALIASIENIPERRCGDDRGSEDTRPLPRERNLHATAREGYRNREWRNSTMG